MTWKRLIVAQGQRALELVDGRLTRVLGPGRYRTWNWRRQVDWRVDSLASPKVGIPGVEVLMRDSRSLMDEHMLEVDLGDREIGLVAVRGKLAEILAPGSRAFYWRDADPVSVRRVAVGEVAAIDAQTLAELRATSGELARAVAAQALIQEVAEHQVGLCYIDGVLQDVLGAGVYGWWRAGRSIRLELVESRWIECEVGGQEILTRDKLSLRVNLVGVYRVLDPVRARERVAEVRAAVYRELQFGLRQAIGTRSLDALLGDKRAIDVEVAEYATPRLAEFGVELKSVGVKDLILPGEMKAILNQVVEAEKQAQAQVIRRREEIAATRSLLNTARLLEESPVLMRLKELEALEKITDKVGQLTIVGGLDSVLQQLSMRARA